MPFQELAAVASCTLIEEVGSTGVGALTLAMLILGVSSVVFFIKAVKAGEAKKFYMCATYICAFAAIFTYSSLAGQGWTTDRYCRQLFYSRYIDGLICNSILVFLLGLIAESNTTDITSAVGANILYVLATAAASMSIPFEVRWLWFLISLLGLAGVITGLGAFKLNVAAKGGELDVLYSKMSYITIGCFCIQALIWVFAQGFNSFSVSLEMTCYALLDVVGKTVVCSLLFSADAALGGEAAPAEGGEEGGKEFV